MDSQATAAPGTLSLRADARGYAIDYNTASGPCLFAVSCRDPLDRADPQTNAQRGKLAAQEMRIDLSDIKVGKDLGVCLHTVGGLRQ